MYEGLTGGRGGEGTALLQTRFLLGGGVGSTIFFRGGAIGVAINVVVDIIPVSDEAAAETATGTGTDLARDLLNGFLSRPNGVLAITSFKAIIASSARGRELARLRLSSS